ncbi:Protein of unknown function, partial [Gryllus bimaculatus]
MGLMRKVESRGAESEKYWEREMREASACDAESYHKARRSRVAHPLHGGAAAGAAGQLPARLQPRRPGPDERIAQITGLSKRVR